MPRVYYPIFLNLERRLCVVVGGGPVAERKVLGLLDSGARVKVISPEVTGALRRLTEDGTISYIPRGYAEGDLKGAFLVIAASDAPEVNTSVWEEASGLGILVNVADLPKQCNFILPSVLRRGGLTLAISTGGASPALAKKLRTDLEAQIGPEYSALVDVLDHLRTVVLGAVEDPDRRRGLLLSVAEDEEILKKLKAGDSKEAVLRYIHKAYELDTNDTDPGSRVENN